MGTLIVYFRWLDSGWLRDSEYPAEYETQARNRKNWLEWVHGCEAKVECEKAGRMWEVKEDAHA